eukprot:g11862.t1
MVFPPSKEAYEALVNEVKALKEENKRLRNVRTTSEVELQPKTRDRKASRNSWADIYNENTTLRKHKRLLGQEVETDDGLEWRVKWGQRVAGVSLLVGLTCFIAGQYLAFNVFGALVLISFSVVCYKNFSFVVAKRLLREMNVVTILVLVLCNWIIDIVKPESSFSSINGFLYVFIVSTFVFLDAVKVKSRVFVMVFGILYVFGTIYNIYTIIFSDWYQGVVLFKYTIQGNEYTFMKRSTRRSIFIQIVLFGMNGIYILFKDRKQELMVFATGNIYRETGTASNEVQDKRYSEKLESENVA